MSRVSREDDEILDLISFQVDGLPHPVDLLSADLVADISGVPKTTLLSASRLQKLRWSVLLEAIERLDVTPGEATWEAMRSSLTGVEISPASVLRSRADELAKDPAFPHFLSGFDHLAVDGMPDVLASICSQIVDGLAPFIDTVLLAGGQHRVAGDASRMALLSSVLSLALQTLTTANSREHRLPAAVSALVSDLSSPSVDRSTTDLFVASATTRQVPEGNLGRAVEAAADLMLAGGVPFRFGLRLADVLRDTGLSSASFYRRFGSLPDVERRLIERAGPDLVRGFPPDLFVGVTTSPTGSSVEPRDAVSQLLRRAGEQVDRHVRTKRPGSEVLPWMTTKVGAEVFAPAFMGLHDEWGQWFGGIAAEFGLPPAEAMDRAAIASMVHALSWIGELLTRNAPNQELTAAFMSERSATALRLALGLT